MTNVFGHASKRESKKTGSLLGIDFMARKNQGVRPKRRKQRAASAKKIDWNTQPARKITGALNAFYATEDSALDPAMARAVWWSVGKEEW